MAGRTFKRCGCRDEHGKQRGSSCPRLGSRSHGTWSFAVDVRSEDGKIHQHRRGGYRTRADAQTDLEKVVGQVQRGERLDDRLTVGEWLDYWLAEKTKASGASAAGPTIRATTARGYRQHVATYLRPRLGGIPLRKLSPEDISVAYDNIMDTERIGPVTLRRVHACLSSALGRAVKARRISYNPAALVDLPAAPHAAVRPWEPAELGKFLDYAQPHRLATLFELMASCGLRRGEALGLRWIDVDLGAGVLTVRQQLLDFGAGPQFGPPKTSAGTGRRVELDRRTVGALLAQQLQQGQERDNCNGYRDHGLVFAQAGGRPYDPAKVTKTFKALTSQAGVRVVRLHDLRHGVASLMLAAGVPIEVVSKRLGHSSISLTLGVYSHLLEGVGRQATEAAMSLVPRAVEVS